MDTAIIVLFIIVIILIVLLLVAYGKINHLSDDLRKNTESYEVYTENLKKGHESKISQMTNEHFVIEESLKGELAKMKESRDDYYNKMVQSVNKYQEIYEKNIRIFRAYLLERKKDECSLIEEIEKSILEDYDEIALKNITPGSYIASSMADYYTCQIKAISDNLRRSGQRVRSGRIEDVRIEASRLIETAKERQYFYEKLLMDLLMAHPEISAKEYLKSYDYRLNYLRATEKNENEEIYIKDLKEKENKLHKLEMERDNLRRVLANSEKEKESLSHDLEMERNHYKHELNRFTMERLSLEGSVNECKAECEKQIKECERYYNKRWPLLKESIQLYQEELSSNLLAIPYMSKIYADIMTSDLDRLAISLSWGNNQERRKKVDSIMALKKSKSEEIEKIKEAEYQLAFLLELYPSLQEVLDVDYNEISIPYEDIIADDPVKRYLDKDTYNAMTEAERNQLALDRYIESRKKSKWQIGRDYELYCGYCYEQKGYDVDYYGSFHGKEDLGRDLIVKLKNDIQIIQCKYWSQNKQIHENHVMQLFGTVTEYNLENGTEATGVLITNTELSEKARYFAKKLGITYIENYPMVDFPRIKCNIGTNEHGNKQKIYHLPFDQQYDTTKIDKEGEFMASTVAEAEAAGFRRAYKWFGTMD